MTYGVKMKYRPNNLHMKYVDYLSFHVNHAGRTAACYRYTDQFTCEIGLPVQVD